MNDLPQNQKVFSFKLAPWLLVCYRSYLRWLRGLLERLGHVAALAAWEEACQAAEDDLLRQVLCSGWIEAPEATNVEASLDALWPRFFPAAIEGLGQEEARRWVEKLPPIQQIRQTLSSLNVIKHVTAEEALHLRLHGAARLCEALISLHGKQGELIAYDLLREGRILAGGGRTGSVAEFIADFIAEPEEANLFSIGLQFELVRATEDEVVLHVRECAWARYFQAHHPTVGYLVACSTDEADYCAFNANLRMQRTSTRMEGGEVCDFRIYSTTATA
jgi:hypothetical protein